MSGKTPSSWDKFIEFLESNPGAQVFAGPKTCLQCGRYSITIQASAYVPEGTLVAMKSPEELLLIDEPAYWGDLDSMMKPAPWWQVALRCRPCLNRTQEEM